MAKREWLIKARRARQLTQTNIAAKLGTTQGTYSAIERGDIGKRGLTMAFIDQLADCFDIPATEIYTMEAEYQRQKEQMHSTQSA